MYRVNRKLQERVLSTVGRVSTNGFVTTGDGDACGSTGKSGKIPGITVELHLEERLGVPLTKGEQNIPV